MTDALEFGEAYQLQLSSGSWKNMEHEQRTKKPLPSSIHLKYEKSIEFFM